MIDDFGICDKANISYVSDFAGGSNIDVRGEWVIIDNGWVEESTIRKF